MDFFKIFIKRILYKIPLKLLLLIVIVLFLSFICFNAKSYAYTSEVFTYNNVDYIYHIPDNVINVFQQRTQFSDSNYKYVITSDVTDSNNVKFYFIFVDSTQYDPKFCNWWDNNRVPPQNHFYWLRASGTSSKAPQFTCIQYTCDYNLTTEEVSNLTSGVVTYNNLTNYPTNFIEFKFIDNRYVLQANSDFNANEIWYLSNYDVYTDWALTDLFHAGISIAPLYSAPYIVTSDSDIENWSFDNLVINLGDEPGEWVDNGIIYQPNYWALDITYNGVAYPVYLADYFTTYNTSTGGSVVTIPRDVLTNRVVVRNGQEVNFQLRHQLNITGHVDFDNFELGDYTLTLTAQQEEEINQDSEKQLMSNIDNSIHNLNNTQQQTNNKIDNLTTEVTNDDVDDMSQDFMDLSSGFEIDDPSGLEEIFQILYDAFCTDQAIDLSFTIPFVNKNVVINSSNISARYPQAVKSIVGVFVWGIVGLWVLKDIRSIVNKIAEGSAEDVGSDVKKEVL